MVKAVLSALTALWGVLLLGPLWSGPALADKRVALVVGNSAYTNAVRLPNPVKDAAAIAAMFQKAGFYVVDLRLDLGSLELKRAMREFNLEAADADIAVVYYRRPRHRGRRHQLSDPGRRQARERPRRRGRGGRRSSASCGRLEPARRFRLVILDACRDNPFARRCSARSATRAVTNGLAKIEPTSTDTLIAYAAKAGSTAEDGTGDHSPFTTALLQAIWPSPASTSASRSAGCATRC